MPACSSGAFPVVAFFLLHGGGLKGFGVSWTAGTAVRLRRQHRRRRPEARGRGRDDGRDRAAAVAARQAHRAARARVISWLIWPLIWLRDQIQASAVRSGSISPSPLRSSRCLLFWLERRHSHRLARADHQPCDLCRHRHRDRGDGARPRRPAGRRYPALGRPAGDAGGVGHRHRRLDAGRHRAGARPALDHSADPDLLDRLHRILARRAADHGAVLRDLHAAAVPARQFHRRRIWCAR